MANNKLYLPLYRFIMSHLLLLCCSTLLFIAIIGVLWTRWLGKKSRAQKRICIVVLGDIGRSPRMQYHALSFMKEGYHVDLVGYAGSEPLKELLSSSFVQIHHLNPVPDWNNQIPRLLSYIVKTLWQSIDLFWILVTKVLTNQLLVQNPPAIPSIPICWLYCCISRTLLTIDWHNYAYSIMAMTVGRDHFLVKITMVIESFFGRQAHMNFCVTKAMKQDLHEKWNIEAKVLYDRPPNNFKPISISEKHSLLTRLSETYEEFGSRDKDSSVLTESGANGEIRLKHSRPALIVSSTSWTEDEDFSVLLTALKEYELACCAAKYNLPDLICAITGKGPLKDFWNSIIKLKKWKHVKIVTPWLKNEDYPILLGSADLGICLHKSSSGFDLPMKVVDMFGCGLPVCAYNFQCLNELVKHEENSLVFSTDKELAAQLKTWFADFPNNSEQKEKDKKFRQALEEFQKLRWNDNWSSVVQPCYE